MTKSGVCVYDLTIPCNKVSFDDLLGFMKSECKMWAFQKEKGEETEYLHYQCRVSLKVKKRVSTMVKLVNEKIPGSHVSPTSTQNSGNQFYVLKDETRVDGPWTDQDVEMPINLRKTPEWYPWQQRIIDGLSTYEERVINVIIDTVGCQGKSLLANWLAVRKRACKIPPYNDHKDIMRMVMNHPTVSCYFVDIPRAVDQKCMHNFYGALEEIKNGHAYDERYRWKEKWFDPPQVWVFTNTWPNDDWLSKDRWRFWRIEKRELIRIVRVTSLTVIPESKDIGDFNGASLYH